MNKSFKLTTRLEGQIKHRWENVFYFLSCLTTVTTFLLAIIVIYSFFFSDSLIDKALFSIDVQTVSFALGFIFIPLVVLIFRLHENARVLASGILVTERQFPDLYELNKKYAEMFDLGFIPNIVINSSAKPISSTIPGTNASTIILHNMLCEIKRKGSDYKPALEFALLREYAHIILGHRTFKRQLLTIVTQTAPIISNFLIRAEEYTADRFAAAILGYDSKDYLCIEATGKFLWENIDINEVAIRAGKGGIFEEIYAITMPLPPITWRIHAIYKMGAFKYKFDKLNFDFSLYDFKNSHGHFWVTPNLFKKDK